MEENLSQKRLEATFVPKEMNESKIIEKLLGGGERGTQRGLLATSTVCDDRFIVV